jgi:hypothetical protein
VAGGGRGDIAADGALADAVSTGATPGTSTPVQAGAPIEAGPSQPPAAQPGAVQPGAGPLRFERLKWISFGHSCIYLALLICAFAIGKPQPETFALGLTHGLLWIFMSLACIAAVRLRVVSLRLAVAVAVLGGIAPFFGSYEFAREQRNRR